MEKKKTMLSAIQPTGVFTLGNYIGAIKNWEINQDQFDCIFFIANLHSLTIYQNPEELKKTTMNCVALLIACGIDPSKSILFVQSQVKQHAELSWVLQCCTQFGELARMTQFKDKSRKNPENINAGLLCYPVLMAADILLYSPDYVPIGADQKQHLEITVDIANRFNRLYGETFKIPKAYIPEVGFKIKSLTSPENKMSKSDQNENGTIFILDDEQVVLNKIKKATTDSDNEVKYDPENKPGISNLLEIYSSLSGCAINEAQQLFKNANYGNFKIEVAKTISKALQPIQEKYKLLISEPKKIELICNKGATDASNIAIKKMNEVNEKVGVLI